MNRKKIALIGGGQIGGNLALLCAQKELGDVVIYDIPSAEGMIKGGGDGMSDSVPATIDGKQDLLVSKDEYVVDAPTVAMIGNGSSNAGAEKLDNMRKEVRKAATGSSMQPKEIDSEDIMRTALS